jgi:SAM-dependent methyltransferase
LTDHARLYLLDDSPFALLLPPPVMSRRVLDLLRHSSAGHSGSHWSRGQVENPEYWAVKQHAFSFPLGFALARTGMIAGNATILDVAGGAGSFCIGLAYSLQEAKMQIIELPGSIAVAERLIASYQLSDRIHCLGLDMFSGEWPAEMDAVLFTNILHDWDRERCQVLAEKAYHCLKPGGRIFIQEALLDENQPGPLWVASLSMSVALHTFGRQFRFKELEELLQKAGFDEITLHPLLGYYSTITGVRSDLT